jgi:hypothetical protein
MSDLPSRLFVFEILIVARGTSDMLSHGYALASATVLELRVACYNYYSTLTD